MTTKQQIDELSQRVGREIATELVRNEAHIIITEEEYEKELVESLELE
jgi:hypothetical protein